MGAPAPVDYFPPGPRAPHTHKPQNLPPLTLPKASSGNWTIFQHFNCSKLFSIPLLIVYKIGIPLTH